jgi:hypothetical protein
MRFSSDVKTASLEFLFPEGDSQGSCEQLRIDTMIV